MVKVVSRLRGDQWQEGGGGVLELEFPTVVLFQTKYEINIIILIIINSSMFNQSDYIDLITNWKIILIELYQ